MPKRHPQLERKKPSKKKVYGSAKVRKLVDELVRAAGDYALELEYGRKQEVCAAAERDRDGARVRLLAYIHNLEAKNRKLKGKPRTGKHPFQM